MDILYIVIAILVTGIGAYFLASKNTNKPMGSIMIDELKLQNQSQIADLKSDLEHRYKERESELQRNLEERVKLRIDTEHLKMREEIVQEEEKLRTQALHLQLELSKKQEELSAKILALDVEKEALASQKNAFDKQATEISEKEKTLDTEYQTKIEKVAKLKQSEAATQVMQRAEESMGLDLLEYQKKALETTRDTVNTQAREMVLEAIQRCSSEVANEATITIVKLKNPEDKGKIIGKQGRNIQWLEKTLGVEIVIDDTPDAVTVSGFNSVRRHVAKRTLEMLLEDGRVHPGSIEDMYERAKNQISNEIAEAGHEAVDSLGIIDFPEKLLRILGRLRFRTSYGQNILKHSVEMARLAKLLAMDMNEKFFNLPDKIDVDICVKGALLHDIGKALDEEGQTKGDHVLLGAKVADTFGLDWRLRKCITAHHDESYTDEYKGVCLEAIVVDACDNISGGRPGARKESVEAFYQRVEAMERIAKETNGVKQAWVMKGSRELWVFFDTYRISPAQMHKLTKTIADRIQTEVRYPGEIKIMGLWEDRVIEYAA